MLVRAIPPQIKLTAKESITNLRSENKIKTHFNLYFKCPMNHEKNTLECKTKGMLIQTD